MLSKFKLNKKKFIIYLILGIIINLFLNYNYFFSLFNKTEPIIYNFDNVSVSEDGYEIKDINKKVNMIQIIFYTVPDSLNISYTSENFKNYEHHNKNYSVDKIYDYEFIALTSINTNVENIKINIERGNIKEVIFNPNIKYNLNAFETIFFLLVIIFIQYIFTKNNKLNLRDKKQLFILIGVFIFLIVILFEFYNKYKENSYSFGNFYEFFYVDSVMKGNLYLEFPADEKLINSANPYDTSNREFFYLWDASYYNGKYYCYFGIWPIISLFIPYKLITNNYLTIPLACLVYAVLGIFATYFLYNAIIKKYFKNINFQTYILSFLFIVLGSKLFWCMHRPKVYELVSLAAYVHVLFGLYLVLFSNKKINNFMGYFLLALSVLCRPNTLLCSVLILPKIFKNIKEKRFKFIDFIILLIPYLVVGVFTMYINYIRFDSIFEFGISYQLTTNNLNNSSFSLMNSFFGLFNYLFGDIDINLLPFRISGNITSIPFVTDFNVEDIGGGIITTSILGVIIFFIPMIFKYIKEKEIKVYIILALLLAFGMIIFSAGIGALVGRYMLDFNYIFYFITIILSLYILKVKNDNLRLKYIYYFILILSIFINFMISLTNIYR